MGKAKVLTSIPSRIIPMRIIPRRIDIERVEKAKPWRMIYGRRKTGKTFLIENFTDYDYFFFVNRDTTVLDKKTGEKYNYKEFLTILRALMGNRIVIDEFHRLPEDFLDFLHSIGKKGELTLITSTLWLSKKLLSGRSPLLGLVYPVRIGLIDERDILLELSKDLSGKELIETAVYLREPFLIPYYKPPIRDFLASYLYEARLMIKELIGEIFDEERRELTNVYEGVMKAVADGRNVSTEISSLLFSRGLLAKDNPGVLQKYLNVLTEMGVLERVIVYGKKRFRYYHASPLIDLHYYLEEKYSYTEIDVSVDFIRKVINAKIPFHVEQFFRNLLSKVLGLTHQRIEERDFDIDVALFEFKKIKLVGEVKWKNFVSRSEIRKIEDSLGKFKCRRVLIVPDKNCVEREPEGIDMWDVEDVLELVRGLKA